ncbi:large conductance mechanosensitive channel protein MscL [Vaginisenegalia massiliensis]|uniref:large conductance mechanosensitive channel protein MscL n=1 Tax=Vaginisenegalia massiliensis TaxID=2058294 RepID=UPI000F547144|nr:large conductance mechanosensitive channel protein MscL [Vaginisenegalia massiliensis]
MWKEFKAFIANDSIVKLATAVIIGGAFTAIINSLVKDIFMPVIVALTGQADVSHLAVKIGSTTLGVGNFLQAIINFLLIAALLFMTLKALEKAQRKKIIAPDPEPTGPTETELLEQILVELKEQKRPTL